jgi:hypothetical protein
MRTPFFLRLQCLCCGCYWWSNPEKPTSCPICRPVRTVDAFGRGMTTYPIAKVLEPSEPEHFHCRFYEGLSTKKERS